MILGAAAGPVGLTVGLGCVGYLATMTIYWNSNEKIVRTINAYVRC